MAGNDEAGDSKPPDPGPLSLDDAERLASQFTPLWEEAPESAAAPAAQAPESAAAPAAQAPVPAQAPESAAAPAAQAPVPAQASPLADLKPVQMTPPEPAPAATPEPTPAMVAIAAPMSSSPDIDPSSTELPDRRSDYAPPRPLAVPQRTMLGLAPPPPVQVAQSAQSATTTPLGLSSAPPLRPALEVVAQARPALQVVAEPSGLGLGNGLGEEDTPPPSLRKRKTGLVIGVMGVAVALVAAVGIRSLFVKRDTSMAPSRVEPARNAEPPRNAAPRPVEQAAPAVAPTTEAPAATSAEPAEKAPAEPAPTTSAVPGENSAVAAAPSPGGVQLAATRHAADAPVATPPAEGTKARTPQRVEEAKRAARASRPAPQQRRPRTESTPKPVSPPLPGAGAIVRQSPF